MNKIWHLLSQWVPQSKAILEAFNVTLPLVKYPMRNRVKIRPSPESWKVGLALQKSPFSRCAASVSPVSGELQELGLVCIRLKLLLTEPSPCRNGFKTSANQYCPALWTTLSLMLLTYTVNVSEVWAEKIERPRAAGLAALSHGQSTACILIASAKVER